MFKNDKVKKLMLVVGGILLSCLFIGTSLAQQKTEVITWNRWQDGGSFATPMPNCKYTGTSGITQGWIDWVAKETKGRLIIRRSERGALVTQADSFKAVKAGMIDGLGLYFSAQHAGILPEAHIEAGLPLAWTNNNMFHYAMYHMGMIEEFRNIYAKHNLMYFPTVLGDIYHIGTIKPIKRLSDLKGKKIRAIGLYGDYVHALGGTPVNIPSQELYMALKLGTIDGVLYGVNGLAESKLDEIIKYYIVEPNLSAIPQGVFINMERWKELPEDIRESLLRNSPYVFQTLNRDYEMNVEFILRNCEQKYGMKRVVLSDEDKKKVENTCYNTLWPKVAAMSENCAKLVNIVKEQQRQLGKLK